MIPSRHRTVAKRLSVICQIACLSIMNSGCEVPETEEKPPRQFIVEKPSGKRMDLTLVGYNYTNLYIDAFSVDEQWGGNLRVSSPGGGGGGSVCCVLYVDRPTKKTTVKVRWQLGACYYKIKSPSSHYIYNQLHAFFKEVEVVLDVSAATKPEYLEVHFYPDGTVQAAVTNTASMPRMILDEERSDRSEFPRCPNDKKPTSSVR